MLRVMIILLTLGLSPSAHADDSATVSQSGDWQGISPNAKHFAALSVRRDETMIWRMDIGTGVLEVVEPSTPDGILNGNSATTQYGSYFCFQLGDRCGARAEWSPDSRYLVITTSSLGGHSPWRSNAYIYCTSDHTLRSMDDVTGLVVSSDFKFTGPHTVRMGIGAPDSQGAMNFDHPKQTAFDLDKETPAMKK